MTGAVAGLATITPAAGYVDIYSSAIIGVIAAVGCFMAVKFKEKRGWDGALDVWGILGMGGVMGTLCLGLFHAINKFIPVRVSMIEQKMGLDLLNHGEVARQE